MRATSLIVPLMFLPSIAAAQTSDYTSLDLDTCDVLQSYEDGGGTQMRCPGFGGLDLIVNEGDLRFDIDVGRDDGRWESPAPFNSPGQTVEWRLRDGAPFAIIYRYHLEDGMGGKSSMLAIKSVGADGGPGCLVGTVAGAAPQANVIARDIADYTADGFVCGRDTARDVGRDGRVPPPEAAAAPVTLVSTGLYIGDEPLPFGMPFAGALARTAVALGEPIVSYGRNEECGAGPLENTRFSGGLDLVSQDQRFAGWSIFGAPGSSLATPGGVRLGVTRERLDGLGDVNVFQSSLGTEFDIAGIFGLLSGPGLAATVTDLWGGATCIFR